MLDQNFAPSYDLLEGKKSTPVRTGALVRKLATGRAGVEFLIDAGDEGACSSDSDKLDLLMVRFVLATSGTLTGWGGSGREGKVEGTWVNKTPYLTLISVTLTVPKISGIIGVLDQEAASDAKATVVPAACPSQSLL